MAGRVAVRTALLQAVARAKRAITERGVAKALQQGDYRALGGPLKTRLTNVKAAVRAEMWAAAEAEAAALGVKVPKAAIREAATTYTEVLVEQLLQDQSMGMFDVLAGGRGEADGIVAKRLRRQVGLTRRWGIAVDRFAKGLAAQGKLTPKQIDIRADAYANRLLVARAKAWASTTAHRAGQLGQLAVWLAADTKAADAVVRVWRIAPIEGWCRLCLAMSGTTAGLRGGWTLPDGRFVRLPSESHPACRCTQTLEVAADVSAA